MLIFFICVITILLIVAERYFYLKHCDFTNLYKQTLNNLYLAVVFGLCPLSIHLTHDNFPTGMLVAIMVAIFIVLVFCEYLLRKHLFKGN